MDNEDEFFVALFCALVRELGKGKKQSIVMQLAELLARRATASVDFCRINTPGEVTQIAARLIRDIGRDGGELPAPPRVPSMLLTKKRTSAPPSRRHQNESVEAAKKAIRLRFDSWRAVKTGGHWHTVFARKMIEQHGCIGRPRIIEQWARGWEKESRQATRIPTSVGVGITAVARLHFARAGVSP